MQSRAGGTRLYRRNGRLIQEIRLPHDQKVEEKGHRVLKVTERDARVRAELADDQVAA
jgi:hypothetical protein